MTMEQTHGRAAGFRLQAAWALPLCSALLIAVGCSGVHTLRTAGVPTVTLEELVADPGKHGFSAEPGRAPQIARQGLIVKVPRGTRLPLHLVMQASVLSLQPGENKVVFHRDVFLYIFSRGLKLSPDGKRWADMGDIKSIKELFGLRGRGTLSVGFGVKKEKGALVNVALHQVGG